MTLYEYTLHDVGKVSISLETYEVEETPKTYRYIIGKRYTGKPIYATISKTHIGNVGDIYHNVVYLTENDFEKARKLLYETEIRCVEQYKIKSNEYREYAARYANKAEAIKMLNEEDLKREE